MRLRLILLIACALLVGIWILPDSPVEGVNTVQLPEFVIRDQNAVVLGPVSSSSTNAQTFVLMHNASDDESFQVQVSRNHFGGADTADVFFTNANCTGTAYVYASSVFGGVAAMRNSVYAVGPTAAGTTACCRVYRGGSGAGSNQDVAINSRFRGSATNGPLCEAADPGINVVPATPVLDLSHIAFPLEAE